MLVLDGYIHTAGESSRQDLSNVWQCESSSFVLIVHITQRTPINITINSSVYPWLFLITLMQCSCWLHVQSCWIVWTIHHNKLWGHMHTQRKMFVVHPINNHVLIIRYPTHLSQWVRLSEVVLKLHGGSGGRGPDRCSVSCIEVVGKNLGRRGNWYKKRYMEIEKNGNKRNND